jgi:tetratricopeptide (TPR) repeat protein
MSAAKRRNRRNLKSVPLRRRYLLAVAVLLVVGASIPALCLWWSRRTSIPAPPVVDLTGVDPAVHRAVDAARTAILQNADSADAWGKLGMVLVGHAFSVEASDACLAQAERLDPRQPCWPYLQATSVITTDPEAAIRKLRRAVALCDCDPDAPRLQLGEVLLEQGRLEEAAEQFLRVLQQHPGDARASLSLGRVAFERSELSESITHLNNAAADAHTRKAAHTLLAQAYERLGNKPAAEQALRQAAELPKDTTWPDPFQEKVSELQVGKQTALVRANSLINQAHYAEAVRLLQQTVLDYPDSAVAWVLLGRACVGGKDLPAGERALRKATQLRPDMADAQFLLGVALFLQKKYQAAAPCFRKATELQPDFAQAHFDLGHCLREQGDNAGALAAFRTAIHYKPDYGTAHFNVAVLLLKRGQRDEALVHLRQAVRLNPRDQNAQWLLDQVLKQTAEPR